MATTSRRRVSIVTIILFHSVLRAGEANMGVSGSIEYAISTASACMTYGQSTESGRL